METTIEYNYPNLVNAAFTNRDNAQKAYDELMYRGYKPDEINVIVSDETHRIHHEEIRGEKPEHTTLESAGIGSAIGGTAGAIAGALIAIGTTVVIPGLGIAVAGPLLAALTGAGAGGLTGGIVGALHHRGVPKEHAEAFESSIRDGGVVISFTPKTVEDRMEIIEAWNRYGGRQLHGNETYTS
ncbi:hypothetical protein GCM10010967_16690 [Dyadobacter beijingensis]|uniref:Heat induced stress protein YflT n=1 Tax=Dyadobacter beijingensis TaxID=365489 RepID=A0ABQ2HLD9_9BACT|nr:hypothetical protein [Dyadobacter beijingensis]GGM85335.1 hypothetical protein GCM10010967_16690 [Dyadobacter beijingensis]